MKRNSRRVMAAGFGAVACGMVAAAALATPSSLITPTNLVPKADLNAHVDLDADRIRFRTKEPTDVRVQKVVFTPGGRTGWHHHPGFVLVARRVGRGHRVRCEVQSDGVRPDVAQRLGVHRVRRGSARGPNLSGATATVYATLVAPNADMDIFRADDLAQSCA